MNEHEYNGNRRIVKLPDYLQDGIPTCPKCGCQHFEVSHTYPWGNGMKRRRRVCQHCSWPIMTYEMVSEELPE